MNHVRVDDAGKKGKGLFAKHAISTEQVIHVIDQPALIAISSSELSKFCYSCYASSQSTDINRCTIGQHGAARLQICTGCRVAWFCGKACQIRAWKAFHKLECKIFAWTRGKGILPEPARALLRFLLQHDNSLLLDGLWHQVLSFESHIDRLREDDNDWTILMLTAKACQQYSGTRVEYDTVLKLLCILKINGMVLTTTYGDEFGVYLDCMLLTMNHSCDGGNVFIHRPVYTNHVGWQRTKTLNRVFMKLLPMRPIAAGEELTVTYVDTTDSLQIRQSSLRKQYFFRCECNKCDADHRWMQNILENDRALPMKLQGWSKTFERVTAMSKLPQRFISSEIAMLTGVVEDMERQSIFSVRLYPYAQAVHGLKLLHMTGEHALDKALVCSLKEVFVIAPVVYTSPIHPHRNVHAIYLLQILALFADTYHALQNPTPTLLDQRKSVEAGGFDQQCFEYWTTKVWADIRNALSKSAADDLTEVVMTGPIAYGCPDGDRVNTILGDPVLKSKAMKGLRRLLEFSDEKFGPVFEYLDS